jgi:hypothetical protein
MPSLTEILKDPNYVNANEATKRAIFDKYSAQDQNFTGANDATKNAIRQRFGIGEAPVEQAAPKEPETGFIAGIKSGYERLKGDVGAIGATAGVEGAEEYAAKQRKKAGEIYKQPEFTERPIDYVTGLLGQSLPYMVAPIAAAAVAPAGLLAMGAAGAASAAQFTGSNISRQLEEGVSAKDAKVVNAMAASVPQAALDVIGFKFMPAISKLFSKAGTPLTEEAATSILGKYILPAAKTAGVEGATEAGQQVLERAQAGLSITDEEARKEYFDSFVGGAILGGAISIPGGAIERARAKSPVQAAPPEQLVTERPAEVAAPQAPAEPPETITRPPTLSEAPKPPEDAVAAMQNYFEGKPEDFGMSFSDIQNRDRTKPASIQQMNSIANNPDYNRLSVSRDFGSGAPVVISDFKLNEQTLGRIDTVSASDGTKIPVQYAVIEAETITPSNRADGSTVQSYADPEFSGIRPVAGNGRVAGLQRAYKEGKAQDYSQNLLDDTAHGINPDVIKQIENPVLIRIMPKSALTSDIADKSNVGGQLGMSPTEQAKIDMGRFDLQGINFLTDGTPSISSLRQFVATMPKEEQAELINRAGQPNPLAKIRLSNALFARAYENDALIDLFAETTDPEAQQILKGMAIAAPAMSNLSEAGDYDIRSYVTKAAEMAVNARRQNKDLAEFIEQGDIELDPLTREIVSMFAANKNAPRRVGDSLTTLAAEANKAAEQATAEPDMFGNVAVSTPLEDVFAVLRSEPTTKAPIVEEEKVEEIKGTTAEKAKFVINKDPEHQRIEKELTGKSMQQVAQWAVDNAPNQFAKAIAQKVMNRINGMAKRGIKMEFKIETGNSRWSEMYDARGRVDYSFGAKGAGKQPTFNMTLNGAAVMDNQGGYPPGTRYITILHELLHVATVGQINVLKSGDPLVKDLENLFNQVVRHFNAEVRAGRITPFMQRIYDEEINPLLHPDELLAWGISDRNMQEFLSEIKVGEQTIMDKLVELIRKILNITKPYLTALDQLVKTTESILDEDVNVVGDKIIAKQYSFGVAPGQSEAVQGTLFQQQGKQTPVQRAKATAQKALQKRTLPKSQFAHIPDDLYSELVPVFAPENKTIIDKLDGMRDKFWKKLAQGIADQYRSIKDIDPIAYMKARMSTTVDGAVEGLLFNGEVKLTDGALDIAKDTKGLIAALEPVGAEVDSYQIWVALNREHSIYEKSRRAYDKIDNIKGQISELGAQRRSAQTVKEANKISDQIEQMKKEVRALQSSVKGTSIDPDIVAKRNMLASGTLNGRPRIDVYKEVQKDMNKLNRSVLNIALAQGTINKEAYEIYANDINYIPFYKVMEETGDVQTAATRSGLVNQYFSKALKGGEKPFGDLMENTLRNWSHILSSSMKNEAANATLRSAINMNAAQPNLKSGFVYRPNEDGIGGKVYTKKTGQLVGDLKAEYTTSEYTPTKGSSVVKTMIDGRPAYFEVTQPMLVESIMAIGYMGPKSKFLDVARNFKNILQYGVTISPAFKVRNLFRDSAAAGAVSEVSKNPVSRVFNNWASTDKKNPAHISALAGGAIFNFGSIVEGDQARLVKRLIKKGVNANTILNTDEKIKNGLIFLRDKYEEFGNKTEAVNRMALYNELKAKGRSHLESSFYARDMLDFSMQGAWPTFRYLTQIVPFLNARTQGLYKLGRDGLVPTGRVTYNYITGKEIEGTDKQKAQQFSTVMLAVSLASLALYMAFKDDEEFQKREQWDRDNFWWFKLPGMDSAFRIPKPFEVGAFGTMVERTAEQIFDQGVEGKVFKESLSRMVVDTFAVNMPQIVKPLIDLYSNKDSFTGAPIETAGMERLSKAERIAEKTGPLAIALSIGTNVFLPESAEISPVQTDYAIKAYFGWLGGTASWLSHYAVQPFSKSAYPDNNWTDTMSMGFIKSLPTTQSKYVTAFYQNNKEIAQAYADMRHFAQLGEADKVQEILKEKGDKIAMAKFYDNASKDMSKMRQAIQAIRNDENMSGAQKKEEIDRMKIIIGEIAKQMEDARIMVKKQYAASQ